MQTELPFSGSHSCSSPPKGTTTAMFKISKSQAPCVSTSDPFRPHSDPLGPPRAALRSPPSPAVRGRPPVSGERSCPCGRWRSGSSGRTPGWRRHSG
eukprot:791020-Prorocentrum_minimum.AAC.1